MSFSKTRSFNPRSWAERQESRSKRTHVQRDLLSPTTTNSAQNRDPHSATPPEDREATVPNTRTETASTLSPDNSPPAPTQHTSSIAASEKRPRESSAGQSSSRPPPTPSHSPRPRTTKKRPAAGNESTGGRDLNRKRTKGGARSKSSLEARRSRSRTRTPPARDNERCSLCDKSLLDVSRYQCRICARLYLCNDCIINAESIDPGHSFQSIPTGTSQSPGTSKSRPLLLDTSDEGSDADIFQTPPRIRSPLLEDALELPEERERLNDTEDSSDSEEDRRPATSLTGLISRCTGCGEDLVAMRYDCESCYASICSKCHESHPKDHNLRAVFNAAAITTLTSSSDAGTPLFDESSEDGISGGASSAGSLSQGADDDDDVEAPERDSSPADDDEEGFPRDALEDELKEPNSSRHTKQAFHTTISVQISHGKPIPHQVRAQLQRDITASAKDIVHRVVPTSSGRRATALLDFNLNLACQEPRQPGSRQRRPGRVRRWSQRDRSKLQKLIEKGRTPAEIGFILNRSASAVSQQWRKQQM